MIVFRCFRKRSSSVHIPLFGFWFFVSSGGCEGTCRGCLFAYVTGQGTLNWRWDAWVTGVTFDTELLDLNRPCTLTSACPGPPRHVLLSLSLSGCGGTYASISTSRIGIPYAHGTRRCLCSLYYSFRARRVIVKSLIKRWYRCHGSGRADHMGARPIA